MIGADTVTAISPKILLELRPTSPEQQGPLSDRFSANQGLPMEACLFHLVALGVWEYNSLFPSSPFYSSIVIVVEMLYFFFL